MATLEVRVKYKTALTRTLAWSLALTSPIWFVFPIISVLTLYFVAQGFPVASTAVQFAGLYGIPCLALLVVFSYMTMMLRRENLVLSRQGLVFPVLCSMSLLGRRNRPWYDLESIRISGKPDAPHSKRKLKMTYHSGGSVSLPLSIFKPEEIEQLLIGIETFASDANGIEQLNQIKKSLKTELRIEGKKSYTNLWEDELRYRYASTTFIPLAPGSTLQDGQIKILRQLGFGGLSAIYLVQINKKELAILKESVLPADVDSELKQKAEEQFQREARILVGLNHPQIAKVMDHFVERGHYLLLEYVHGEDLRQYVAERGSVSEAVATDIGIQIAEILNYLHTRNPAVIHRDLTPENLIIDDSGKIVLIDFGAANEFLHTATGTLVGKHAFMAPEQLRGKAGIQSDLYALGGTLQYLLTGKDPIPLAVSQPRSLNEKISEEMDKIVTRLTQLSKDDRFADADELKSALDALRSRAKK